MKRRLPVDIDFLMESILSEDPDGIRDEGLYKLTSWYSDDAVAFICFDHFDVASVRNVHYNIIDAIKYVAMGIKTDYSLSTFGPVKAVGAYPVSGIKEELKTDKKFAANMKSLNRGDYRNLGLTGRLWTDSKLISFWNKHDVVIKHWDRVVRMFNEPMFKKKFGNLDDYRIDFVERNWDASIPLKPASEITSSGSGTKHHDDKQLNFLDKLSDKQIEQLQKKLHTMSPQEKAKALVAIGANNYKAAEIASKLGMSVAEFNHLMQVNEEMLTEDPDSVLQHGQPATHVGNSTAAFFLIRDTYVFSLHRGMYHWHILKAIYYHLKGQRIDPTSKLVFGDLQLLEKYLTHNLNWYKLLRAVATGDNMSESYRTGFGVSGRIWREKKIISMWNAVNEVKQQLPVLKDMFAENERALGKLEDYKFDYISRRPTQPLLSLGELESFGTEKTGSADIKKLQQIMHVASPEKKRDILSLLGAKADKSGEIADKLGISKAELNYMANVNEIKLTELLKRILEGK